MVFDVDNPEKGLNLDEFQGEKTLKKYKINVWNYSKNVVKLKIRQK